MTLVHAKKKKKSIHPEKKAQKTLQPIKKKQATEKSTTVLLKALTTIPGYFYQGAILNVQLFGCLPVCKRRIPYKTQLDETREHKSQLA